MGRDRRQGAARGRARERARRGIEVHTVSFSPDGGTAARGEFAVVVLWDVRTGKEQRRLRGNEGNVYRTRFSQDGRTLASCHSVGSANRILLWDVATGKERGRISGRNLRPFAISPDGKLCATGDSSLIRLWDVASGKILRTITTPTAPVHCLAFAPDGRLLASGDSVGGLFLCDSETGEEVLRASGHQGSVTALAFDGGRRLASASLDTTVLVWDLATLALASARPSAEDLEKAWDDLARQARPAYRAHWILRNAPDRALVLLRRRLNPAETVTRERLRQLIAELDSDRFAVRERATGELARLGTAAEAALRRRAEGGTPARTAQARDGPACRASDGRGGRTTAGAALRFSARTARNTRGPCSARASGRWSTGSPANAGSESRPEAPGIALDGSGFPHRNRHRRWRFHNADETSRQ